MAKDIKAFCGYCEFAENCEKHFFECDKHEGFAEIAKDQRKIDIEKFCKWFEHFCKRSGLCNREWRCTFCPRIIELKQAMEE